MAKPTASPRGKSKKVLGIKVTRGDVPEEDWKTIHKFAVALEKGRFNEYIELLQNPKKLFFTSVVVGVGKGFGAVLGATVVIALLVWLLSALGDALPGELGNFFSSTSDTINPADTPAP